MSQPPSIETPAQALCIDFHPEYDIVAAALINGQTQL
jgi:hypothetical protein